MKTEKHWRRLLLLAAPALLAGSIASAKEGPDQYPNGIENFMAGALPPPGNYFINYLGYYEGGYRDNGGDKVPGLKVNATFDALRYIYVSNYKIFGGDWAMHAIVPLVYQKLETPNPAFGNDWVFGLGDITIDPIIVGWHFPPDWHVTVGLDIYLPTGKYDKNDPTDSIGANYYSFEPVFSFTYLNQSGFEVSAKLMYNIKTENDDTDYQSGDDFHMDYLVGQHFGPWAVGIGGYYFKQTTDDEANGVKVEPDGNRGQVFAFGPTVKYDYKGMSFVGSWSYETAPKTASRATSSSSNSSRRFRRYPFFPPGSGGASIFRWTRNPRHDTGVSRVLGQGVIDMANKQLFRSRPGRLAPETDARNEAGGRAYTLSPKAALAQYVATGCLNATFYADAATQLDTVLDLCAKVEPAFVAKAAVYARWRGQMKDMPALLTAWLAQHGPDRLEPVFAKVIDNGRMLRNFVQILRSGAVGRKSLGSRPKRLVQNWLNGRGDGQLLGASVGNDPSLADVLKMVHPKPATPERTAFYAWLIGKPHDAALLPEAVKALERFRDDVEAPVPDVPFELLTALPLRPQHWVAIACQAPWQMTRMNLNTFARHEVFKVGGMGRRIAERLRDPAAIRRARVFPYQLLSAYYMTGEQVPDIVRDALQDALEVALENVPELPGQVYVLLDVSGSMASPVTGHRKGATSRVRCVDVAALVAAAISAKNPATEILPFDTQVHAHRLNRRDSVLTNAQTLAKFGGGGTDCGLPLATLNQRKAAGDLVIYVSDNESWADPQQGRGTETMRQWETFRQRNPRARLACIDIQPYGTTQAQTHEDVLNVSGFSDAVFEVLARFAAGQLGGEHWVREIEAVEV